MLSNTIVFSLLLLIPTFLMILMLHKQRKVHENQIKLLNEQIKKNILDCEHSNSKLENYFYKTSHEVRGPLARILGMIHLIDIHSVSPQDGYERIKEAAVQLDKAIQSINANRDDQRV